LTGIQADRGDQPDDDRLHDHDSEQLEEATQVPERREAGAPNKWALLHKPIKAGRHRASAVPRAMVNAGKNGGR